MAKRYSEKPNPSKVVGDVGNELGTVPPQAIDLEEAVLGALMIEKESILKVQEILKPESFYKVSHQIVYQAILDLSSQLEPVDLYTVYQQLLRKNKLEEIGGRAFLVSLTQTVGSAAHIEFHAKIIAQKFVQRELIRASTDIQRRSFDPDTDVTDLIEFAEGEIFKVASGNIKRDVQDAKSIVAQTLQRIEEARKRPEGISGVPCGFTDIDKLTSGWQPSDLIIIAARPSMGKTAFVLSLARNMAVEFKKSVAFFSLEMSNLQLMTRLFVAESELDSNLIKNGRLSPEEWAHLEKTAVQTFSNTKLFIDDTPSLSIYEFRSKVRRLKAIYDIDVIIIDYLQLMTGANETKGNREQEVASISRALKAIAKELNVPIMALSQLNRGLQARNDKRPQLSDLRESGSIEQDADIVAFIHRPEYYGLREDENQNSTDGLAEIIFAKHRNGATDTVKMRFQKHLAKFSDWDGGSIDSILMQGGDISSNSRVKIIESSMNSDGFEESPF